MAGVLSSEGVVSHEVQAGVGGRGAGSVVGSGGEEEGVKLMFSQKISR